MPLEYLEGNTEQDKIRHDAALEEATNHLDRLKAKHEAYVQAGQFDEVAQKKADATKDMIKDASNYALSLTKIYTRAPQAANITAKQGAEMIKR